MALVEPSVMANAIMAKLYDTLANGDDTVPSSEDNFFSFATPGIPMPESSFDFLVQGLTGVVKRAPLNVITHMLPGGTAGTTTPPAELDPAELERLRTQDSLMMYQQAESLARLVDFVPDLSGVVNDQLNRLNVMNIEGSLSQRYEYILRRCQVMKNELPAETKAKIEKLRGLLSVKKIKKNLIDDSEVEVSEPSPLVQIYNEKLQAYEAAALEYNARRIDALAASDQRAVHYWAINASILRNRVEAAKADWVANGYKNDYEEIAAFIDHVMGRDMALLLAQYKDDLEKARLTGPNTGSDFYHTSVVPGNFARATGWTQFTFQASDFEYHRNSSNHYSRSAARAGGAVLGIFGGGGGSSSSGGGTHDKVKFESDRFSLRFKIAQVPIVRPWFNTAFLVSRSWRFDQNDPEARSKVLNDGKNSPDGYLPAYPTSLICIKNLELIAEKSEGFSELTTGWEQSRRSGGGFLSLGPINLGGSFSGGSSSSFSNLDAKHDHQNQTMRVPGMQVVGFKCHILPKSPDPNPEIKNWV